MPRAVVEGAAVEQAARAAVLVVPVGWHRRRTLRTLSPTWGRMMLAAGVGVRLAAGFLRTGHRVLSEDLVCCRSGAEPMVVPGPATIRIRPDVYERIGGGAGAEE